jgi:tRNA(Ile)-lysidine synthetase-like protein
MSSLYWRLRKQGDEIYFHGMHRKLRRLYNRKKIPPRIRQQLPLLCDEKGILWAPFIGMRDGVSFDGEEDYMVELLLPQDLRPMTDKPAEDSSNN